MGAPVLGLLQRAYRGTLGGPWRRFARAARDPERAQAERLREALRANARTAYGRAHGFEGIRDPRAYQDRVPIVDYDALEPWIARAAAGEAGVLTAEPVRMFERSGGSTATNKLVPYTESLLAEFSAATGPWLHNLFGSVPGLYGTRSYWSVSPATRPDERTAGGVPIGFEDDTEYFGSLSRWVLARMLAVPAAVARIPDMDAWRRATLRHLVAAEDLGLVSVWSPTFLTLLMETLARDLDAVLGEVPAPRAGAVRVALDRAGTLTGEAIWPRLRLLSCWADGPSAAFVPALRRWFPRVALQPKGLLATEGVVSFPLVGCEGGVLALAGHFLEFQDVEHPGARPLLAHEIREGGAYSPILTTRGGFYRYHLKDVVRCLGFWRRAPLVRFEGKLDRVSDLCGEKINARQVDAALARVRADLNVEFAFALLAPEVSPAPRYVLYVEADGLPDDLLTKAGEAVEGYLATGQHYRYCRDLGQLGALEVRRVRDGWPRYQAACLARGQRAGDIKPTHLDTREGWGAVFGGEGKDA